MRLSLPFLPRTCSSILFAVTLACAAGGPASAAAEAAAASAPASASASAPAASAKSGAAHAKARKAAKAAAARKRARKAAPIDTTGTAVDFLQWPAVQNFVDRLVEQDGFARADVEALFGQIRFVDAAVQLIKPAPPGKPKNWHAYSNLFIEPTRIAAGIKFWDENAETLARAETAFGVPAEIIVGIIGVETVYGQNTGRFRVLDALATLAFAYPEAPGRPLRLAFFRDELENALLFARVYHLDPLSLLGSYAGAVGLPQFMPGNILKFGIDFDNDGVVDLRNSPADAIGSVANFLTRHGWQRGDGPPVYAVTVSPGMAWQPYIGQGLEAKFSAATLMAAGIAPVVPLPEDKLYGLVDLQNGAEPSEYWLGTNNFFAIAQYNRSFFYAMSVIELGRAVRLARGGL